MTVVMVMDCLEEVPSSSTIFVVEQFSSLVLSLIRVTRKWKMKGLKDPKGKRTLIERAPQPIVAPRSSTRVLIRELEVNPSVLLSSSTFLFVRSSHNNPTTTTDAYSSSKIFPSASKDLSLFLSIQIAVVASIKLFQTLVDTAKLIEIGSHSLKHQVCHDFTKAIVGLSKWLSRSEGHTPMVNIVEEIEEQAFSVKDRPSLPDPIEGVIVAAEQETVIPRTSIDSAVHLVEEAND
ncbi:hypothetical protein F0562_017653 [Nyssa sinensis]|uniref:Uncharacterized protein n=1 Tax=Nyssa sinensis TaxID=561372 RepID=A0A5J4ZJF1_9ASTE|nr:hypothetical protein F0562_017653 [Nyssa sinensis]